MRVTHHMRDDQSNDASYDLSQGPMGLFSFRKKDAEAVPPKRGSRRSGRTGTRTAGGGEYSEHEQLDPLLPEKQRARRRLVGALALVLAAVIILPMVLAPEPKPAADDIAIQIPGKDANSPPVRVKPQAPATLPSEASLDKGEEALDSSTLAAANAAKPAPTPAPAPAPTAVPPAAAVAPAPAPSAVPEPQVAQAKPEHKSEVRKPEQHAETKPATKPDSHDTAKAQAKSQPDNNAADPIAQFAQNNTAAKPAKPADNRDNAQKSAASGGKYLVRIGAFSTQDRAQAWLVKLKLVNVPSYMVKSTVDGRELYLLRAGPFPDRNSAEAAGKKIRDAGLTAQVAEAG